MKKFLALWFLVISLERCAASNILKASSQLLVVCTGDWEQVQGKMQCFEKNPQGDWVAVGDIVKVCVGKNGLGWGIGLHPRITTQRKKQEGDSRAPAGVFHISAVFSKFPECPYNLYYQVIKPTTEAIDDPQSHYYNTIVDANSVEEIDWKSSEKMSEVDLYDLGLVIDHNMPVQDTQAGSCIFMHRWRRPGAPTAGCTAMDSADLETVCHWLDSAKKPCLVQLPIEVYSKHKQAWKLPDIAFAQPF